MFNKAIFIFIGIFIAGCASHSAAVSSKQACPVTAPINDPDAVITTNVEHALMKADPKVASEVQVRTKKGIVLLSGFVHDKSQAERLIKTAVSVPGVVSVNTAFIAKKELYFNKSNHKSTSVK